MALSPSLRIKYIFLTFLRTYYSGHPKYTWVENPKDSKIIIADKFITDLGIAAMRPTVVIDRGSISWTNMYRNEALPSKDELEFPKLNKEYRMAYSLTDQLQSSITFNIMAKAPFMADEIANEIFINLSGYREWFKDKGIHKFTSLGISKESISKISAGGVEIANVSVQLSFLREQTVRIGERLFNCRIYNGDGDEVYEEIDFRIKANGTQVEFFNDISGPTIDYIDAITLNEISGAKLVQDNENTRLFTVPNNGSIYGYYNLFEHFKAEREGSPYINVP